MAKTYSIDVSAPANAVAPSGGAAAIRLLKNALHERANIDHYWEKSGNTIDADEVGYHRKATLMVQGTAPTAVADAGIIYGKDVSAKCELFYRDEDGDEVQLTSGGAINASAFVSGDLLLTTNTGAKSGWTDKTTTYASKYIRIGATALATGGASTHTHTGPSHTHTFTTGAPSATNVMSLGAQSVATGTHTHSGTTAAGGTGTTGAGNNAPLYVDVRIYQKD